MQIFDSVQNIARIGGSCRFTMTSAEGPLTLTLEENGVITRCSLTMYDPEFVDDVPFDDDNIVCRVILRSHWLKDAFLELDAGAGSKILMKISTDEPRLELMSDSDGSSTSVHFPNQRNLIESFFSTESLSLCYRWPVLRHCMKAVSSSQKVSIRVDKNHALSLQFMITSSDQKTSFVEFKIAPFDEELL